MKLEYRVSYRRRGESRWDSQPARSKRDMADLVLSLTSHGAIARPERRIVGGWVRVKGRTR